MSSIGKNTIDVYYRKAASLCGIEFGGTCYSSRFGIVSLLTKAGVSLPEIKANWTTHSTTKALEGYYDSQIAQENELDQQNKFHKYIQKNKNNLNDFNSIKYFIECNNLLITFPLETDYGKAIHFGIKCVDCNNYPIIGQRYKCYICKDINLCYKCEKHHNPTHPLIQFKKSSKITDIVIYNDDNKQCHDNNNNIECICGAKMEMKVAKLAYNWANCVFCDCCDKKYFNEMVYHCPKDRNVMHKQGFDLCISCSKRKVKDLLI
eukprot:224038_1